MASSTARPLWITEAYPPHRGGMAQSCDRIVRGLRSAGVSVDVAHLSPRYPHPRTDRTRGGRIFRAPTGDDPGHALNRLWNTLASEAEARTFTHVVAFGGTLPLLAGPEYAAWLGVPLVTLLRGNDFDSAIFSPTRAPILRHALTRSARVCTVSRDKAERISRVFPEVEPVWTPNGIDLAEWSLTAGDRTRAEAWRREHVDPGRRVLGLFGQLKPKKGALFLLEALLRSGRSENLHVLLVGDVDAGLGEWLEVHGGSLACTHIPFLDRWELLPLYRACDLVAIPSFYDGMPNVLLEAMGVGVPLLAASAGGMADVLVDGEHGFIFAPGDAAGCRLALDRAASRPLEELRRMGERCRADAGHYTAEAEARRYVRVLEEALHR